jgi:hypothetical protein
LQAGKDDPSMNPVDEGSEIDLTPLASNANSPMNFKAEPISKSIVQV